MKKLPYGISDYEQLVKEGYYYVDKTKYIEQLEEMAERTIMCLRPRKFGKTLFTSVLENYYDIKKVDEFETLFGETYIGENPTKSKNTYHILRFNFAGIDTSTVENTISGFQKAIRDSIEKFIKRYTIDFYINPEEEPEWLLKNLFTAFSIQKENEKIYVIVDEYDHFANELLSFDTSNFKKLVSENGKVRKWYEKLKEGTESVVDRIFITGVAPITLDSLTSGFNIATDITMYEEFNSMMGFSKQELEGIMETQEIKQKEQKELLPIMKENYDGYTFSSYANEKIYNSNMCLYFLTRNLKIKRIPDELVDTNIASDYKKIANILNLCKGENKLKIIKDAFSEKGIVIPITRAFNPEKEFTENDMASMLYYLGYLTITDKVGKFQKLNVPNKVIKELYADYFLTVMQEESGISEQIDYNDISTTIAKNLNFYKVKTEIEKNRKYMDLMLIPEEAEMDLYTILIEFKYLKKGEKKLLEETRKTAKEQIKGYGKLDEIKNIKKLIKYTVVVVNDEIYVDKI